jgi:hypothetical protein
MHDADKPQDKHLYQLGYGHFPNQEITSSNNSKQKLTEKQAIRIDWPKKIELSIKKPATTLDMPLTCKLTGQ